MNAQPLMILIAGPYRSGTNDDPALMEKNLRNLESVALPLYRAGHIPLIGEWLALPLLREAGSKRPGDAIYESKGADEDVRLAKELGLPVYSELAQVPGCK